MLQSLWFQIGAVLVLAAGVILLTGCASRGVPLRPTYGIENDPPKNAALGDSWYIESRPVGGKPYSCSFVEFDERGDYVDFQQQRRSWQKIKELSYDHKEELLFEIG